MKHLIKKQKLVFITLIVLAVFTLLYFVTLPSVQSIQQKKIVLKIGVDESKYSEENFQSELIHCYLFQKKNSTYIEDLAITSTSESSKYITGIKDYKFGDGSPITMEDVVSSLPSSFNSLTTDIFHTPITDENISKYFFNPIVSKDGDSCGAYVILNRNQNETILEKNKFFTSNQPSPDLNYEKIVFRKIDLNIRNESDVLNDLVGKRIDVLINVFSPKKTFSIINQYPQLKIHTYASSRKSVLLVKRDSLTNSEISSIIESIDVSYISKFVYNSTLIPLLKKDPQSTTSSQESIQSPSSAKKTIYFITTSSVALLKATKILLSKFDPNLFSPILQVIDPDDVSDFALLSKNANLILIDTNSNFQEDFFHEKGWDIYPLWQYQDIVISNDKIKDPSVLIR